MARAAGRRRRRRTGDVALARRRLPPRMALPVRSQRVRVVRCVFAHLMHSQLLLVCPTFGQRDLPTRYGARCRAFDPDAAWRRIAVASKQTRGVFVVSPPPPPSLWASLGRCACATSNVVPTQISGAKVLQRSLVGGGGGESLACPIEPTAVIVTVNRVQVRRSNERTNDDST
jgi:hypothetical protein